MKLKSCLIMFNKNIRALRLIVEISSRMANRNQPSHGSFISRTVRNFAKL